MPTIQTSLCKWFWSYTSSLKAYHGNSGFNCLEVKFGGPECPGQVVAYCESIKVWSFFLIRQYFDNGTTAIEDRCRVRVRRLVLEVLVKSTIFLVRVSQICSFYMQQINNRVLQMFSMTKSILISLSDAMHSFRVNIWSESNSVISGTTRNVLLYMINFKLALKVTCHLS